MKIVIASSHCTRTDLIEMQYKSLKKFIIGEFDYYIFNDARSVNDITNFNNPNIKNDIEKKCLDLGVFCINVPQNIHKNRTLIFPNTKEPNTENAVTRCADTTQYMYEYFYNKDVYLIIIDADMFLIDFVNVQDYLQYDICFVPQSRSNEIIYAWNGLLFINCEKLKIYEKLTFDCGVIDKIPVDVGGYTYFWFRKYENKIKTKHIDNWHITSYDQLKSFTDKNIIQYFTDFYTFNNVINKELLLDKKILHLRGDGGNWDYSNSSFLKFLKEKYIDTSKILLDERISEWKKFQEININFLQTYLSKILN